jgi:5-methylcytosine-specific restriction endonuclease McrA
LRDSIEYKRWRMKVFLRDNFTCQFCWKRGIYLEAHHIKDFKKYPKLRFKVENGITL